MKSYEVTYKQGHLVDIKTGKRIFLKRGGKFKIHGTEDQFEERDELLLEKEALDSDAKYQALKNKHKKHLLKNVLKVGDNLLYRIGLSKQHSGDKDQEFLFDAFLLEDLYLYSKDGKSWALCDCICETRNCIDGELQMIEPIRGKSLNSLFSNMVAFYFPLQRSGTCNAFSTFHLETAGSVTDLSHFKHNKKVVVSLDRIRQQVKEIHKQSEDKLF
jgi:hypothetical protein